MSAYKFKHSFNGVCLNEGALVETDQGVISIELINNTNTIQNVRVIEVIETFTFDQNLICIDKDALGINYPNKKTIISQSHKIMMNGILKEAKDLVNVIKIPYNGERLYNILFEINGFIKINNLMCESLDTNDYLVDLYKNPNKTEIMLLLNSSKNEQEYKKIALLHS
jgi:hypothetical protein